MRGLFWVIAIVVLQAVIAAIAKKAQANAKAAAAARASSAGSVPPPPPPAPRRQRVLAVGGAAGKGAKPALTARQQGGAGSRAPRGQKPSVAPVPRGGDSAAALLSRQHLAERVAKVREAEARVANASGIRAVHATATKRPQAAMSSQEVAAALRNPREIRKAIIVAEVLGRPRAERGF